MNTFDPIAHKYAIAGRPVPGVTTIIEEALQIEHYGATRWHLEAGSAVHGAIALMLQGKEYELDLSNQEPAAASSIRGRIEAGERFLREINPKVIMIEQQVYSEQYQYAGTFDLLCEIQGRLCLFDWKSTLTKTVPLQLAGYAMAWHTANPCQPIRYGFGVELHDDGSYKMSERYELRRYFNKFLALRSVYSIREEMGMVNTKGEGR